MSTIKRYALVQQHSPADLVATVTSAIIKGWMPIGGVATTEEAAKPQKGIPVRRIVYTQALVLPHRPSDAFALKANDEEIPGAIAVEPEDPNERARN